MEGKYICFEGVSGCGKDTQIELTNKWLIEKGYKTLVVDEPTEFLNDKIKENWKKSVNIPLVDTFLFLADRAYHVEKNLKPALNEGKIVLSNRSFVSNLAYQQMYVDLNFLLKMNYFVPKPDLIIIFDLPVEEAFRRLKERKELSRFEKIELMEKIRKNYLDTKNHLDNVVVIDGNRRVEEIQENIKREIGIYLNF